MKHANSSCECTAAVSPLALRWGCSVCGKTAIIKVSILAAICDGDTIRGVKPETDFKLRRAGPNAAFERSHDLYRRGISPRSAAITGRRDTRATSAPPQSSACNGAFSSHDRDRYRYAIRTFARMPGSAGTRGGGGWNYWRAG